MFVRSTDLAWSIANLSHNYPGSTIKIPSSAYSLSMNLAISVNFWDVGPESVGEDMHMYLKCFFATKGNVIVKSIYSPVSCCNVEGKGGYFSFFKARYNQSKRHLWGSLDTGYVFRRSLISLFAPEADNDLVKKPTTLIMEKGHNESSSIPLGKLFILWIRMFESHILFGQFLIFLIFNSLIISNGVSSGTGSSFQEYWWDRFSTTEISPFLLLCMKLSSYFQLVAILPQLVTIGFYELYHEFAGFTRWKLYDLGKRPTLESPRQIPWSILDFVFSGPAGLFLFALPSYEAQISQLFTDSLDYEVAAKPLVLKARKHISEEVV
jgi:hypothetical protein